MKKKLNELEMEEYLRGNEYLHLDDLKFGTIAQSKLLQNKLVKASENISGMDD